MSRLFFLEGLEGARAVARPEKEKERRFNFPFSLEAPGPGSRELPLRGAGAQGPASAGARVAGTSLKKAREATEQVAFCFRVSLHRVSRLRLPRRQRADMKALWPLWRPSFVSV